MTQSSSPSPDGVEAGSVPALDVFALCDSVVGEYKRFATSFTTIHAPDIREQVEGIYARDRYWPEPLIASGSTASSCLRVVLIGQRPRNAARRTSPGCGGRR